MKKKQRTSPQGDAKRSKKKSRKGAPEVKMLITVAALTATVVGWGHFAATSGVTQISDQPIVMEMGVAGQTPVPIATTRSSR